MKVIPPESRRGYNHLPAIDGLRAFAVLSVVAYHAGLPLSAGYVGVDVFFVISGFVITRMLLSEPRIDLAAFYARRVRRILPALVVVVAATLALSAAMLGPDARGDVTRSAMASAAMVPNVWFQFATGGYFDAASDEMPLLHLWSLGVEEQFYLLWPLLLMLRRRWLVVVLALASFAGAVHFTEANQEAAFYQMPLRFWELAVGGFVAMLPKSRLGTICTLAGLALLAFSVAVDPPTFPGFGAAVPVLGSALVLHAIHSGSRIAPLECRAVRYVGLISYSLYLWHWPLLAIARGYSFDPPSLQTNLALCALAFGLACLSYHFIELPFRRTNPPKVRAITLGVTACAMLAGCAAAVGATTPKDDTIARLKMDFPAITKECHAQTDDPPKLPPLSCGDGDVVLWGDSHAYAWRPFADRFGSVRQLTRSTCPPSVGDPNGKNWCEPFDALAVERAKQGKVVILAARWTTYAARGVDVKAYLASAMDALSNVPRVIVMGPVPEMPYSPQKCIAKGRPEACFESRQAFEQRVATMRVFLKDIVRQHPNAEYVEPVDYFCSATTCPLMKDGRSLYWDDDHIAASAARMVRSRGTGTTAE